MEPKIIVILDSIQRTIIATLVEQTANKIHVIKPAVLNVAPSNDKKLQVQLYPVMFREFLKNRDEFPVWKYDLSSITLVDNIEIEANLISQYTEMFRLSNVTAAPTIKLFDSDETKK